MPNLLHTLKSIFLPSTSYENSVISEQKAIVSKLYPENLEMQDYIIKKQLSDYKHLQKLNDLEIKELVTKRYPANYTMQRYIYEQQVNAKNYMKVATNSITKAEAENKYPKDYFAQKYVYDSGNLSA